MKKILVFFNSDDNIDTLDRGADGRRGHGGNDDLIAGARHIFRWSEENSPLQRNVQLSDVGGAALYLLSDLSKSVTGEIHHVDSGYNIIGIPAPKDS